VARSEEAATSRFAEYNGKASEEVASIREGIQAFCEFFKNSQFDKMAQFYSPDTTVMLPHRPTIRVPAACLPWVQV
jgi:ketosteroid isomerase-like protein